MREDKNLALIVLVIACLLAGCSQADTHADPQMPPSLSVSYLGSWGVRGDGPGQLDQPACIATDAVGNAYIADAGSHFIEKFDPQGTPLLAFEEDSIKHPQAITVDSGGAIYVTDSGRGSAIVFFPNGDRLHEMRVRARPNVEDALSIAVDDDGTIHILDAEAGKILTYDSRFRLLRTWVPAAGAPSVKFPARA